ncbi:MAG: beta-propeller fold lactonase family protein [Acidobacteriota bacterium]
MRRRLVIILALTLMLLLTVQLNLPGTGGTSWSLTTTEVSAQSAPVFLYTNNEHGGLGNFADITGFSVPANGVLSMIAGSPFPRNANANLIPNSPTSLAINPTANFLYASNGLDGTISAFAVNATTGMLTQVAGSPFPAGGANPGGLAISPQGTLLFAANADSNTITSFTINTMTGALTQTGTIATPNDPLTLVVNNTGTVLYASIFNDGNTGSICAYTIGANGVLTTIGSFPAGAGPNGIVVSPTGGNVYVVNQNTQDLRSYQVNAGGSLTLLATTPFGGAGNVFPVGAAISPGNPNLLFAAASISDTVHVFNVSNPAAPVQVAGSPVASGSAGPFGIEANNAATLLYVTNLFGNTISGFTIGAGGTLTPIAGSPFANVPSASGVGARPSSAQLFIGAQPAPPPGNGITCLPTLFATDTNNNRIQFSTDQGSTWTVRGSVGSNPGQFRLPEDISSDGLNTILVADTGNNRVQRSTNNGMTFSVVSTGTVSIPQGVHLDPSTGFIYVSDTGNSRILRSTDGGATFSVLVTSATVNKPQGIRTDLSGFIYVADTGNSRVLRSTDGGLTFGVFIPSSPPTGTPPANTVKSPEGIAIGCMGQILIADSGNSRILLSTNGGASFTVVASATAGLLRVNIPEGVAFTTMSAFVADSRNNRILRSGDGGNSFTLVVAGGGFGPGQFAQPSGLR